MKKLNIGILGSTSHIAKGLVYHFLKDETFRLRLYTRSPDRLHDFLTTIGAEGTRCEIHEGYAGFSNNSHDAIINCVGIGTLNKFQGDYTRYFAVTEEFDNLSISYLRDKNPEALYVSLTVGRLRADSRPLPARQREPHPGQPHRQNRLLLDRPPQRRNQASRV